MHRRAFLPQIIFCFFFYFLNGIIYSQLTGRMPALKAHANVDEAGVGLALMSLGMGSLVGFTTIGLLFKKLQSRTILSVSAYVCLALFLATTLADSLVTLCLNFALIGLFFAYYDVTMNTQIINLELASGGQYMLRMHAGFNVGSLTGSVCASLFAFAGVGISGNFTAVALFFILPCVVGSRQLLNDIIPEEVARNRAKRKGHARIPLFVIFCGLMALCAYTIEGAVGEWGGLVMHQTKNATEGLAALVYGTYSLVTAIVRFNGDRLRAYFGDFRVVLFGGFFAFAGMSTVIFASDPYVTLGGYALTGVGLSSLVPLLLSRVGHRPDIAPSTAASVVSLFGFGGMLVIPPSLGFLARRFGLEEAMFLPLFLICLVIAGSFVFRFARR